MGWGLFLAGAAVIVPAVAGAVARRRTRPPHPLRWGRTRRYSGPFGEIVFQELDQKPGTPLLLLHSLGPGHDAEEWRATAELLRAHYPLYVPDLPGWGRSAGPRAAGYHPGLYPEVIGDFLRRVVREPAVLVASGLSAAFAVRVAAESPELVRALALVTPRGLGRGSGEEGEIPGVRTLLGVPVVRESVLDFLTRRPALARHLRGRVYAAPERVDAALLEHCYRASHRPRAREALAAWLLGRVWTEVEDLLPALRMPVWIAWGRAAVPPVEEADLWLSRLPRPEGAAGIEVFEGSGCLPHAETPAAFCRALDRFISGLPA